MKVVMRTYAAATCSWINPSTGLPENDKPVLEKSKSRGSLTGKEGFRFCNFADVFVKWNGIHKRVEGYGFQPQSDIYRAPSFLKIPSHAFPIQQRTLQTANCIEFIQIAGARTVSAEIGGAVGGTAVGMAVGAALGTFIFPGIGTAAGTALGGLIGAPSGEIVAHQALNFPPIWSKLKITMFHDGRSSASVLQYSHFPSLTFYKERAGSSGHQFEMANVSSHLSVYHAGNKPEGERWHKVGWGPAAGGVGPSAGNPWGVTKGLTGGMENIPTIAASKK